MRIVALTLLTALASFGQQESKGRKLYTAHCAACHGATGTGGRGPNLTRPDLRRGNSVETIAEIVRGGIPGSEMGPNWMISPPDTIELAKYVKALSVVETEKVAGDAAQGRQLFFGKAGCAVCHIVNGRGNGFGPELSSIGGQRSVTHLRQAVMDPSTALPEGFLWVEATPRLAKPIRGVRLNEDSFTIQLRDQAGRLHSLAKADLQDLRKLTGQTPMPAYKNSLKSGEIDDMIAWLVTLDGRGSRESGK